MSFCSAAWKRSSSSLRASLYHSSISSPLPTSPLLPDEQHEEGKHGQQKAVCSHEASRNPRRRPGVHVEDGALLVGELPVVVHPTAQLVLSGALRPEVGEQLCALPWRHERLLGLEELDGSSLRNHRAPEYRADAPLSGVRENRTDRHEVADPRPYPGGDGFQLAPVSDPTKRKDVESQQLAAPAFWHRDQRPVLALRQPMVEIEPLLPLGGGQHRLNVLFGACQEGGLALVPDVHLHLGSESHIAGVPHHEGQLQWHARLRV